MNYRLLKHTFQLMQNRKRFPKLYSLLITSICFLLLSSCASKFPVSEYDKLESHAYSYQSDSKLGEFFSEEKNSNNNYSGFYPLSKGHDALLARIAIIEAAEVSIDVQYYIYRSDESSQLMTWRLFEAAQRGVKVRLLLDDMQSRSDENLANLSAHPNIEVRLFNPFRSRKLKGLDFLHDFGRVNHRMHNKSLTVDGVTTIMGGRNIGNEYFSVGSNVEFSDLDLLIVGPVVSETGEQFDQYWNHSHSIPIEWLTVAGTSYNADEVKKWAVEAQLRQKFEHGKYNFAALPFYQQLKQGDLSLLWGKGRLIYDSPDKITSGESDLIRGIQELLDDSRQSLFLVSPYFVPTESGTQAMVEAAKNGKFITIITNSLASNDVVAVHGWYSKYRKQLIESGVHIWEVKSNAKFTSTWSITGSSRSSLHAKLILIDIEKLMVGSMNWDPRSARTNTEMAVIIKNQAYSQKAFDAIHDELRRNAYFLTIENKQIVWHDLKNQTRFNTEPKASFLQKLVAWVSGVLPVEDLL